MAIHFPSDSKVGFVGGTLLSISANLHPEDFFRTVVLGVVGATTSYVISMAIRKGEAILKSRKSKNEKESFGTVPQSGTSQEEGAEFGDSD